MLRLMTKMMAESDEKSRKKRTNIQHFEYFKRSHAKIEMDGRVESIWFVNLCALKQILYNEIS